MIVMIGELLILRLKSNVKLHVVNCWMQTESFLFLKPTFYCLVQLTTSTSIQAIQNKIKILRMNFGMKKVFLNKIYHSEFQSSDVWLYQNRQQVRPKIEKAVELKDSDDSFQFAISPVASFVQFMGLMPVCGISQTNPKLIKFRWKSIRVAYTILYTFYGFIVSTLFFTFIADQGISAKNIGKVETLSIKHIIS